MAAPARPKSPPRSPGERVSFDAIPKCQGIRIGLYGPGGIGKTSLAASAPGPVAFFDLDESLPVLREQLPEEVRKLIHRVEPSMADSWQAMRNTLNMPGWESIRTIVIDTATKAEELAAAHTLATVPHEKGNQVERIEDYGYGKGYTHLFDTFMAILGDLDQHVKAGRNVILVMHDCTSTVPNPMGEDWIRYEPRLSSPASGKASIRLRVREWLDHLLFVGYDVVAHLQEFAGNPYPMAWLFEGETGTGKTTAAMALAAELGCDIDQQELGGVHVIASGEQTADAVRQTCRQMHLTPLYGSGWQVVIVNEVDRMSPQAETVWLDRLEQLPRRAVVVFSTNHPDRLSQRFRDRCTRLRFESAKGKLSLAAYSLCCAIWRQERRDEPDMSVIARVVEDATEGGRLSLRRVVQVLSVAMSRAQPRA